MNSETIVVQQILQTPDTPSDILDAHADIWLPQLQLAGMSGNFEIMKLLLSTRRFRALVDMREEASSSAVAEGRFETNKFICDPQWGPMNFVRRYSPNKH